MRWFYAQDITSDTATITGDENKHLNLVMRAKAGDHVVCFNGNGLVCECEVEITSKNQTTLKVVSKQEHKPRASELIVAAAAIKGERQDTLIRQATELGVTGIILLETERSEVKLKTQKIDKIERQLVACCKQCHMPYLPKIKFSTIKEFLQKSKDFVIICGSLNAKTTILQQNFEKIKNSNVAVLIGPEGGFSPAEEDLIEKSGAIKITLGQNVLRADTASTMLISLAKTIKEW